MADKTIGDLTQAESIGSEDLFVLEQGGEAKKLKGSQLIDYVTFNVISVTVETLPAGSQATATYNEATGTLSLGIPQGEQGNIGPANTLTIGAVTSGAEASATITGDAPNQVLNLVLQRGEQGDAAPTITNIAIRQSDYHMIVTLSDGTSYDAGYCRGASGAGTGDMIASIYDPQGKTQDIFAYVDDALKGKQDAITGTQGQVVGFGADGKPMAQDAPSSLPAGGTAGQVLAKKGEADYDTEWKDVSADVLPVNVEIIETICENIELTNSNPSYTFPTAITIDSDGLYYISHSYYKNDTFDLSNSGYLISKPETIDDVLSVRWLSSYANNSITMTAANIVDTWVATSAKSIISIYKVNVTVNDEMKKAALLREGYSNTASGNSSHAEGHSNTASGESSHAEGYSNTASGNSSHAEGRNNTASGYYSHAEGYSNTASGNSSHAEGIGTIADNYASHAQGKYNKAMTTGGTASNTTGDAMVIGNGTNDSARSNAFRVTFAGAVYGLSAFNSSGADYAEFFEWHDLNPDAEDRVGYFVTLTGKQIRMAGPGDYILGIVSGQPCIIGNSDDDWLGRWLHDEFGRFIKEATEDPVVERRMVEVPVLDADSNPSGETKMEMQEVETGEVIRGWRYKENPDYDNTQQYIERKDRQEWDCVGMLGVLAVRDDGTCEVGGYCQVADGGIATSAASYVPGATYMVIERVTANVIKVVFR